MMNSRRQRKAKAKREQGGFLVQFIPGGFYHLHDGALLTGVFRREAGAKIAAKLMPLAKAAAEKPGEWVTLP